MTPGPPLEGKGEGNEGKGKGQGRAPIRLLAQGPQHVNPALIPVFYGSEFLVTDEKLWA